MENEVNMEEPEDVERRTRMSNWHWWIWHGHKFEHMGGEKDG